MPDIERKKALLIAYYWPLAGGPGVMRWLRFSKYFDRNQWDLTILVPHKAQYPIIDESLLNQVSDKVKVVKVPIFEPAAMFGKMTGNQKGVAFVSDKKPGLLQKVAIWFRGNFLIPDARKFWIQPASAFLEKYLKDHPQDVIISTGPPHSVHLIALNVKKKFGVKWLADFRDPWTGIDFYNELMLSKRADNRHHQLEKMVLSQADFVTTVSNKWAKDLEKISGRKVNVIGNGYEFPESGVQSLTYPKRFSIAHFGSMPAARNPRGLWEALQQLLQEQPEMSQQLELLFAGNVDFSILADIEKHGLKDYVVMMGQISHQESLELQKNAALLLLVANDTPNSAGILTGKFYEYLAGGRPILAFGPAGGDLEMEIRASQSGDFVHYGDVNTIKSVLRQSFVKFKAGNLTVNAQNLQAYDSKQLAAQLCRLIRE